MGIGSVLLLYLIKILFIVFIVSLLGGMVLIVKNNIFTPEDIEILKGTFKSNKLKNQEEIKNVEYKEI